MRGMTVPATICFVVWQDACVRSGNFSTDDVTGKQTGRRLDRVEMYSVGFLVTRSEDTLTIANDYDPVEEKWRDLYHIPTGMIVSLKKFRLTPTKKNTPTRAEIAGKGKKIK